VKTSNVHIKDIACLESLTCLQLNNCYRVNQVGLAIIAEKFPKLEVLELSGTLCNDVSVHQLSRHLINLTRLDLSRCIVVSDASLGAIGSCLKKLRWLNLQGCCEITDEGLPHLYGLKELVHCDLTATVVTEQGANKLQ
jgi:hypothetical protein